MFGEADYLLGLLYLETGNFEMCEEHFENLINNIDYKALGWYGRGLLEAMKGHPNKSKHSFSNCIKENPEFSDAYLPLGLIEYYQGHHKRSLRYLNTAVDQDSTWQEAILLRGFISLLDDEEGLQFEKDMERLLRLDPDNYHYQSIKGYLNWEKGNYGEALANFRTALNMVVDTTNKGTYKFSTRLKQTEDYQYILNYYFENKYELSYDAIELLDIGLCEFLDENYRRSLKYIDSVKAIDNHPFIRYFEGLIYENRGFSEEEAITSYTLAIQQDSSLANAFRKRSGLYYSLNKIDFALVDIDAFIELQPKKKVGFKNRGIYRMKLQHFRL